METTRGIAGLYRYLPDYPDEGSPQAYWGTVTSIIAERLPSWRIRSWAAVGVFPFAKLAMYMDLDPADDRLRAGLHDNPGNRGEQKEGPQPEEPKHDKARSLFERWAKASLGKI